MSFVSVVVLFTAVRGAWCITREPTDVMDDGKELQVAKRTITSLRDHLDDYQRNFQQLESATEHAMQEMDLLTAENKRLDKDLQLSQNRNSYLEALIENLKEDVKNGTLVRETLIQDMEQLTEVVDRMAYDNKILKDDAERMNETMKDLKRKRDSILVQTERVHIMLAQQKEEAAHMDNEHKAVNSMLDECWKAGNKTQQDVEEESMCQGYTDFKCEHQGRCILWYNSYAKRSEPFCQCTREYTGRTCGVKQGEGKELPRCQP